MFYSVKYWCNSLSLFILNMVADFLADRIKIIIGIKTNIIIYNISIDNIIIDATDIIRGVIRKIINMATNVVKDILRGIIDIKINIIRDIINDITNINIIV